MVDIIGGDTQERSWSVLKPGGILVSTIQAPSEEMASRYGVRGAMVMSSPPIGKVLTEVAELVDNGQIKPHVSTVLPLEEAKVAHEKIEGKQPAARSLCKLPIEFLWLATTTKHVTVK